MTGRLRYLSALKPRATSERTNVYCRCAGDSSVVQVAGRERDTKRLGGLCVAELMRRQPLNM